MNVFVSDFCHCNYLYRALFRTFSAGGAFVVIYTGNVVGNVYCVKFTLLFAKLAADAALAADRFHSLAHIL